MGRDSLCEPFNTPFFLNESPVEMFGFQGKITPTSFFLSNRNRVHFSSIMTCLELQNIRFVSVCLLTCRLPKQLCQVKYILYCLKYALFCLLFRPYFYTCITVLYRLNRTSVTITTMLAH